MDSNKGVFIVLEGSDGSGKGTQFKLLTERLKAVGHNVEVFDFPRYDEPSSYFVRQYLNGAYGPASSISPYTASLFYALDRYEASESIRKALKDGKIVLSNRFVGSNMAHQGSKFKDPVQQRGFFVWEDGLEYNLLGIPRPDINVFLRVPAEISYKLISQKNARNYTSKSHDEHEADIEHLRNSVSTYETLTKLFPKDFQAIECTENGIMLSIPEVNNRIWEVIRPILPAPAPDKGHTSIVRLDSLSGGSSKKNFKAAFTPTEEEVNENRTLTISIKNLSLFAANSLVGAPGLTVANLSREESSSGSYYQLPKLNKKLAMEYSTGLKQIGQISESIRKGLKAITEVKNDEVQKILGLLTPLSTLTDIEVTGNRENFKKLATRLSRQDFQEVKWLAKQLEISLGKKSALNNVSSVEDKPKTSDYISLFIKGSISNREDKTDSNVQLLTCLPRNEFDLIAEDIYPKSDIGREAIIQEIELWPYERKAEALESVLKNNQSVKNEVIYKWDVLMTLPQMMKFLQNTSAELNFQVPTARYGYDVPELIKKARLEDSYTEAFELSNRLYTAFQRLDTENLSPYTTLLGHRRRWLFTAKLSDLEKLYDSANEQNLSILRQMVEQLMNQHSLIANFLLSKDEAQSKKPQKSSTTAKKQTRTKKIRK